MDSATGKRENIFSMQTVIVSCIMVVLEILLILLQTDWLMVRLINEWPFSLYIDFARGNVDQALTD